MVLRLTKNVRLQPNIQTFNDSKLEEFFKWILNVGDGKLCEHNDGYANIDILSFFFITSFDDPMQAIVQST